MSDVTKDGELGGRREIVGGKPSERAAPRPDRPPPAGPHDDPALTNTDATPGTGALTPPGADEIDSTSG